MASSDFQLDESIDAASTPSDQDTCFVIGDQDYTYQDKTQFDDAFDDIAIALKVEPFDKKISLDVFWNIILNEKVPVVTSLVAVMGLPSCGKTTVLESVLKHRIKLKPEAKLGFDQYLKRKKNKESLSIYELCALGSSQHDKYAWSFATNRYGAIFSILYNIIRRNPCVADIKFEMGSRSQDSGGMDKHVRWLMGRAQYVLEKIKDEPGKLALLQDGISFINVIDVGVNKALYDFLSIMLLSCHQHIRLAFFSLDRDAPNLGKTPDLPSDLYGKRKDDVLVMQQRSRLTYLLHFATVGYTQQQRNEEEEALNATVMVATRKESATNSGISKAKEEIMKQAKSQDVDQFLQHWLQVDMDDVQSIAKEFGDEIEALIKSKYKQGTIHIPLRWIVFRSLVISLDSKGSKVMILRKSFILDMAKKLKMTETEVDEFLKTFTDFGSVLHMPQYDSIKDIVIVNIWEFTQYLNKLFYPQEGEPYAANLLKYGIISESSVKEIFYKHPESAQDFMLVLTTIAMASKIESGQSILIDNQQQPDEAHYYLPLARTREVYKPSEEENDYAFIEIESVNFPANVQACISNSILENNEDAVLIATEHSNVSQFLFQSKNSPPVKIEMIYKGSKTRLRIMNNSNDILTSPAAVEACKKVITGSCQCLQKKFNIIRDLKYSFAVPCASPEGGCHFLYYDCEPQLCDACSAENNFRLCWSKAAKQCELLSEGSEARMNESIDSRDIISIMKAEIHDFDAFKKALNIDESKLSKLSSPEDEESRKKMVMLMLLLWERQTDKPTTRHALITKLRENGLDDIAKKLKNLNTTILY
ncbi:PREDICTED: uncharacterized protein LOC109584041 [Amphimedon queenslandica]|uniref:Death domain-containing protein n=1 Tax=Amphimedon queenslandica TaxID=400682 RepID=A0A1X7UCB6_AMPQE|nr:PREDICTED: uncharacterized protein LOC109584041 [Amphimedon queenslandica]|eukprot:XP_019855161.1 PREDICTED: uncharacterized protein LOC109584041 [Amphimedon queenslandica]